MIKTIKENIVFSNSYFKVYNNDVVFNGKKEGTHLKIMGAKTSDGIAVLPILENGNIVIIKNFRYAVNDWVYQAVKGGNGIVFKTEEDALKCMDEELEEEVSMKSDDIVTLNTFYETPSIMSVKGQAFLAKNCKLIENSEAPEDTEVIDEVMEFDPWLIDDFLKNKNVCSTTLYLIKSYQLELLKEKLNKK